MSGEANGKIPSENHQLDVHPHIPIQDMAEFVAMTPCSSLRFN